MENHHADCSACSFTFSILVSAVNVLMNFAQGKFMTALSAARWPRCFTASSAFSWLHFSAAVPLAVFYRYMEERLSLALA